MSSRNSNPAKRRYLQGSIGIALTYIGSAAAMRLSVNHWHPRGWHLWLAAALPTLPILCFAYIVGRYLREERDEYQRDLMVRGMLWGAAVVLCIGVFTDYLRSFGWHGSLPPFTYLNVFWLVGAIVQAIYHLNDRVAGDA